MASIAALRYDWLTKHWFSFDRMSRKTPAKQSETNRNTRRPSDSSSRPSRAMPRFQEKKSSWAAKRQEPRSGTWRKTSRRSSPPNALRSIDHRSVICILDLDLDLYLDLDLSLSLSNTHKVKVG